MEIPIFKIGESHLTLGSFLYLLFLLLVLFWVASKLRRLLEHKVLARSRMDASTRLATATVFQYTLVVLGLFVILQTAGIDLTTLNILAGAVGIGVGFGLQNIANNFISGLIILFERPIKIGDRIVVGDIEGDVVSIAARSTTVLTNDNIAIIVPNSKFITEEVINWSHNDARIRFRIPLSVAYGSDARQVERLLLEVAAENKDVLADPAPGVRLVEFGDNGLHFELRAWTTALLHRRGLLVSALNFAIYDKLRAHGIEIPFPQRDIHIRSGPASFGPQS
ncbi:MAG TPA: mechanosensitive ion channel domain-containing protein [Candidatus Nitrosotenuis sp.]|nr:mechanosensitive ion channel domain-containing protein [Candidatus Nitrosotenuis sp.]